MTTSIDIVGHGSALQTPYGGTGSATYTNYAPLSGGSVGQAFVSITTGLSTAGLPMVSGGSFAYPAFTALTVAGGGSGVTTNATPWGVLCQGASASAAMHPLASVGTVGQFLVSGGASAYPSFQSLPVSITGNNMIVNGDFQIWQRGSGGSASFAITSVEQYGPDRWQIGSSQTVAMTFTQVAGATSGSFLCRAQRNSGTSGTGVIFMGTSLTRDMCIGAAGNIVTVSFKAACGANYSSASSVLTVNVVSGTGTSDISAFTSTFTGAASPINSNVTLTTSLTNFTLSSSALGATVTQLAVQFTYTPVGTASTNDWFQITDCMLEISPTQNPYQRKSYEVQLHDCKFFYDKTFAYATLPAQNVGTNTGEYTFTADVTGALGDRSPTIPLARQMRASPTLTLFSPGDASAQIYNETASAAFTGTATATAGPRGFAVTGTGTVGTVIGDVLGVHYTADCDLT